MPLTVQERRKIRRNQISDVQQAVTADGSVITEVIEEDAFTLQLALVTGEFVCLKIPEKYPEEGSFVAFDVDGEVDLGVGSIKRAVHEIVRKHAVRAEMAAVPSFADEPPMTKAKEAKPPSSLGQFTWVPRGDPSGCKEKLVAVLHAYASTHADLRCGWRELSTHEFVVRVPVTLPDLDRKTAHVWGVNLDRWIVVEMRIAEPFYLRSAERPKVIAYEAPQRADLSAEKVEQFTFGQYVRRTSWLVRKRVERDMSWPYRDEDGDPREWLPQVVSIVRSTVMNCNKTCMICGKDLDFVGLKPAVCGDPLCTFGHMQFGLGEDVLSELRSAPDTFDLLLSCTAAAAAYDVRRFNPYPDGVEAQYKVMEGDKQVTKTESFVDAGAATSEHEQQDETPHGGSKPSQRRADRVTAALEHLMPVADMSRFKSTDELRDALDKKDRLSFPLVRWVLTSCRAHLVRLEERLRFKEMTTPYQFLFASAAPEVEKAFNALKREHGSFLAWHGSTFGNWHAILRMGLQNYSGSSMQSNGAAYGAGIYMAADSGTSLGYAGQGRGWTHSVLKASSGFQGLALCEVVDFKVNGQKKYTANPYYVVPEEKHVLTRYFFVFADGANAQVPAQNLMKWHEKLLAEFQGH